MTSPPRGLALFAPPLFVLFALAACSDSPAAIPEETATAPASAASPTPSGLSAAGLLLQTFDPFALLRQPGASREADPSLRAPLITSADLPDGYSDAGDLNYALATPYGDAAVAASIFTDGDFASGRFDTLVFSAVVALPDEALEQLGDPSALSNVSDADLEAYRSSGGQLGALYREVRLVDATGLGEGGAGVHTTLDFSAIFQLFGPSQEQNPFAVGAETETYLFVHGDRLLVAFVMWPAGRVPEVEARALAEAMDASADAG